MEITVVVFCYNSEKTVVETLNSIYRQTYKKIHLVVSDDCSKDKTIEVVKNWLRRHDSRFLSTDLIVNDNNLGISLHFDKRIRESITTWVKPMAGDDILLSDCIENYVNYIEKNKDLKCGMIVSNLITFIDTENGRKYGIDIEEEIYQDKVLKMNPYEEYKNIIRREILCSPTIMINSEVFKQIGGGDLEIRNIEDWSAKIKITKNGYSIRKMSEVTVLYRQGQSISRSNKVYFKPDFLDQIKRFKEIYCYPYISKREIAYWWNEKITDFRYWIIMKPFKNKRNKVTYFINALLGSFTTNKLRKLIVNIVYKSKVEKKIQDIKNNYGNEII